MGTAIYVYCVAYAFLVILGIVCLWKIFAKAGRKGWECLIPIWNSIVLCKIAKVSPWWLLSLLLGLVPVVGSFIVLGICIWIYIKFAQAFGKGIGFGLGLAFFSIIFFPILAFGDAEYEFDEEYEL